MTSDDRIQELNRQLRELASSARKAREEFEQYTRSRRGRGSRPGPAERNAADDSGSSASQ